MHACMHACIHAYMHAYMHAYNTCIHTYVHTYMHTYMHTIHDVGDHVVSGDDEALRILLEEGADPEEGDDQGRTALDIAQDD